MLQALLLLLACCFCCQPNDAEAAQRGRPSLDWMTNFDQAVEKAQKTSKPIVLFFTGSDWCSWCSKLEEESLETPEFIDAAGDKFIFVKLDFPLYTSLDPKLTSQNKQIQNKYNVRQYPTLIILDAQQNQIGKTGYRPGGGKQYAEHLLQVIDGYSSYRQRVSSLDTQELNGKELKSLYEKAKELSFEQDAKRIVHVGLKSDKANYFLLERYRALTDSGKMQQPEAVAIRKQILESDPRNERYMHYQVAVIDFEAFSDDFESGKCTLETAVSPLCCYIDQFSACDKDNIWRLQMVISQMYLEKNRLQDALVHAQSAYAMAPCAAKNDIALAVKNIQSQIHAVAQQKK